MKDKDRWSTPPLEIVIGIEIEIDSGWSLSDGSTFIRHCAYKKVSQEKTRLL